MKRVEITLSEDEIEQALREYVENVVMSKASLLGTKVMVLRRNNVDFVPVKELLVVITNDSLDPIRTPAKKVNA